MAYFLDVFSPETYEAFKSSDQSITGFRERQLRTAERIQPGDKFICYMTKLSRWIGLLEITSECFVDKQPLFYKEDDPFVVRFRVTTLAWLDKEKAVPIREDDVWSTLSFTRDHEKSGSSWTGKFRSSMTKIDEADGNFLEELVRAQASNGKEYQVDESEYRKLLTERVRREGGVVTVSVPTDDDAEISEDQDASKVLVSIRFQGMIAEVGERMGFKIWLPKNDRSKVSQVWNPSESSLLDALPLNYDLATLRTIEQIDVIWLKGRSIVRAFEVEHTTAVYSGILRMADLLALQPNMDIKLHIVAPADRRDKVFQELQRPVFSLLDRRPLSETCTFISYDSVEEIVSQPHISHLQDTVLEEYEEIAE